MNDDPTQFDVAGGTSRIVDDTLVIDRSDPLREGRWAAFASGLSANARYRPLRTGVVLAVGAGLGLVFGAALWFLYRSNPAVTPLILVLVLLALLAVGVPLERAYRRGLRERRNLREDLDGEFRYERPGEISFDAIKEAALRRRDTSGRFGDGYLLLVHYRDAGTVATTHLGFPQFMKSELETARAAFEQRGIGVEANGEGRIAES